MLRVYLPAERHGIYFFGYQENLKASLIFFYISNEIFFLLVEFPANLTGLLLYFCNMKCLSYNRRLYF